MSAQISQGTRVAIASTYGSGFTVSAVSNASEAVATLSGSHGIIVGDIFELTSGWDLLDKRLVRAKVVATNDVTLESIDTSSTTQYPAGEGVGTGREITVWTSITQISDFTIEPTTVDFVEITTLANLMHREIPGLESAPKISGKVLYDLSLSWITTVLTASDTNALTGLRLITPNANKIYMNAYWKLSRQPELAIGQAIKQALNMTMVAWPTAYSS
jgi:Phage tail tube protein, TTP